MRKKSKPIDITLVGGKPVVSKGAAGLPALPEEKSKDVTTAQKMAVALVASLSPQTDALDVCDAESREAADEILGKITKAQKDWAGVMEDIIRPISDGLQKLYAMNRSVDRPLEDLAKRVKRKIADYDLLVLEQKRAEEEAKERARQKLLEKAAAAPSPIAKLRVEQQLQALEEKPVTEMPQGEHSTSAPVRKIEVEDIKRFCEGIAKGLIPEDCIEVKQGKLNTYHREDRESVESWPGVRAYDDMQVGRR